MLHGCKFVFLSGSFCFQLMSCHVTMLMILLSSFFRFHNFHYKFLYHVNFPHSFPFLLAQRQSGLPFSCWSYCTWQRATANLVLWWQRGKKTSEVTYYQKSCKLTSEASLCQRILQRKLAWRTKRWMKVGKFWNLFHRQYSRRCWWDSHWWGWRCITSIFPNLILVHLFLWGGVYVLYERVNCNIFGFSSVRLQWNFQLWKKCK